MFIELTMLDTKPALINTDRITLIAPSETGVMTPEEEAKAKRQGIPVEVLGRTKSGLLNVRGVWIEYATPDEQHTLKALAPTYEEFREILKRCDMMAPSESRRKA